jgi:prevent-host-death family protein
MFLILAIMVIMTYPETRSPKDTLSVAEAKAQFSAVVTAASVGGRRVTIRKHNRPVAVLIGFAELDRLERGAAVGGLAEVARRWTAFEEMAPYVTDAIAKRKRSGVGRHVSL